MKDDNHSHIDSEKLYYEEHIDEIAKECCKNCDLRHYCEEETKYDCDRVNEAFAKAYEEYLYDKGETYDDIDYDEGSDF